MALLCATRHLKNARHLQATAPHILPREEPPDGYASRVPFDLLGRLHAVRQDELGRYRDLAEALRRSPVPPPRAKVTGSLFNGSLIFAQISFRTRSGTVSLAVSDLQTAITYAALVVPPISRYAAQYGPNQSVVSTSPVPFGADVPAGRYNDQTLRGWVNAIASQTKLPGNVCVMILNPRGIVNTDGDPSQGIGGYHGLANVPYCFVNAMGSGFTVADPQSLFALAQSHEIAEMVVDPQANLGTSQRFPPPFAYGFFINGIVKPDAATACPAPAAACNYAPP